MVETFRHLVVELQISERRWSVLQTLGRKQSALVAVVVAAAAAATEFEAVVEAGMHSEGIERVLQQTEQVTG